MCINQERTRGRRYGTLTSTVADIHRLRRISGFAVIRTATLRVSADVNLLEVHTMLRKTFVGLAAGNEGKGAVPSLVRAA